MSNSTSTEPPGQPRLRDAYERVQSRLALEQDSKHWPLNADPLYATATVRSALPALMALRPSIVQRLTDFELRNLDELELYALALIQSHGLYLCAKAPPEELARLAAEATKLRERLLVDVAALVKRKYLSSAVAPLHRGPPSFSELVGDVIALSNLLRTNWDTVASKCGVTQEELDQAEVLGDQLNQLLGARARAPAALAEATRQRRSTFTLFARAYDQVRKAVTYLRWEQGDADTIAPPFRRGKRASRKKPATVIEGQAATAELAAPSVTTDTN